MKATENSGLTVAAAAQDAPKHGRVGPDHARKPVTLEIFDQDLASHSLHQKVVSVGPGHRLFIAVPKAPAPVGGWPVLYMLDGNAAFDYLTADQLALVPGLVVVGVGYDTDRQFSRERRTLDFTAPDGPGDGIRPDHVHEGRMAGGAAVFLDLLTGPLRAAAEERLAIDASRRTLWGHSFGGLFTLYALLAAPQSFARYAPISPSIWWDEALIRKIATQALRSVPPPAVISALGDMEKRSGAGGPPPDGPPAATVQFLADLAEHPGIKVDLEILRGHVHIQTLAGSFARALPFAAA